MALALNAANQSKRGYLRMMNKKVRVSFKDASIDVLSFKDIGDFLKYADKTFERQFTRYLLPRELTDFIYLANNDEFKAFINEKITEDFIFDKNALIEETDEEDYNQIGSFPEGTLVKGKYFEDENRGSRLIVIDPSETFLDVLNFIMDFSSDHFYFLIDNVFIAFSD